MANRFRDSQKVGQYQSVKFNPPIIHGIIETMGGWIKLAGDMKADDEKWKQREFERLYDILSRNPPDKYPEYLPGVCEVQNAANGYEVDSGIVRIGFERLKIAG